MAGSGDSFFKGFVFGSIVGGIVGVLLAPKSGKEMREDAGKIFDYSKSDFENARKAAMTSFEQGRDKIIEKMTKDDIEKEKPAEEVIEEKPKRKPRKSKPKTD